MSTVKDWRILINPPSYLPQSYSKRKLPVHLENIDGVISRDWIELKKIPKKIKARVIGDSTENLLPGVSTIVTNSTKIGQIAANYFLNLGYSNFAFCGFEGLPWSDKRLESYSRVLQNHGITHIFQYEENMINYQNSKEKINLEKWLKQLPKPISIFACNDDRAFSILEACKAQHIKVPEEIAILGVDNDELICKLSSPALSSIELNFEKAGYIAANHLDNLIQNKETQKNIHVTPIDLKVRQSTDFLAIHDQHIISSIHFIKNNFKNKIKVEDVVQATQLSRRELERRFQKILKTTIKKEISKFRIQFIKNELRNSTQNIQDIAKKIFFTDPEHLSRFFKNETGQTPLAFRKAAQFHK